MFEDVAVKSKLANGNLARTGVDDVDFLISPTKKELF